MKDLLIRKMSTTSKGYNAFEFCGTEKKTPFCLYRLEVDIVIEDPRDNASTCTSIPSPFFAFECKSQNRSIRNAAFSGKISPAAANSSPAVLPYSEFDSRFAVFL